jgi:O-antigen ligase
VILSLSRAGMIAILVGLIYVGLRSSRALTALLLLTLVTAPLWAPDYLKDRITGTTVEGEDSDEAELDNASQMRVSTWQALFRVIGDHPIDGVGFNALPTVLPQSGAALGVDVMDSSHNSFLRMQGELGIFGLGVFAWVLWNCWSLASAALRAARSRFDRQLAVGLGASALALVISCGFGDRFFNIMITGGFWLLCALAEDILHEVRPATPTARRRGLALPPRPATEAAS